MSETFLNDVWSVYFHDPKDSDWTYESYKRMGNVSTVEEFLAYCDILRPYVVHGMFFVMREHIFPCWDDPGNVNGETVSMKILKEHVGKTWESVACSVLGETFMADRKYWSYVNGISISPKRSFCIIKIWMAKPGLVNNRDDAFIPHDYTGELVRSANADNIKNNNKTL